MKHINSLSDCDIIVLCGLPLSGKTYLTKLIQSVESRTRTSEALGLHQSFIFIDYALQCGNKVIVDQLNLIESVRNKWIKFARDKDLSIGLLIIESSMEKTKERLEKQVKILGEDLRPKINDLLRSCTIGFEYPGLHELDLYDIVVSLDDEDIPSNSLEIEEIIKNEVENERRLSK